MSMVILAECSDIEYLIVNLVEKERAVIYA